MSSAITDTRIFEPEGRAIPYAVEGHGPAVVLVAGHGLNISTLRTLAHSVALEDFRVVVAEACPRARCTVTTSHPEAIRPEA